MSVGLLLSYGTLAVQGALFILPRRLSAKTRKIFVGQLRHFTDGQVKGIQDLEGNEILVKRSGDRLEAFSAVCPHLGCRVHWEQEERHFFCPCHRGIFDENGTATAGPPADAKQVLARVNLDVDSSSGAVYLEVKDTTERSA